MELVRIDQEIRTNLTITDKQGLTVKLNELGPPFNTKDLDKVAAKVAEKLGKATWFMICGSVPPGVPAHFYNHLIELAHKKKVKTLLDTDGDALAARARSAAHRGYAESAGSRAPPQSCSHHTHAPGGCSGADSWNGRALGGAFPRQSWGYRTFRRRNWSKSFPRASKRCALSAQATRWLRRSPGRWIKTRNFVDAVRWGVAAGTASAKLPGVTYANLDQTKQMYSHVDVRSIG